jgi:hypothetical protein
LKSFQLYGTPSMMPDTRTFPVVLNDSSMLKGKIQTHRLRPQLGYTVDVASSRAAGLDVRMDHCIPKIEPVLREAFVDLPGDAGVGCLSGLSSA